MYYQYHQYLTSELQNFFGFGHNYTLQQTFTNSLAYNSSLFSSFYSPSTHNRRLITGTDKEDVLWGTSRHEIIHGYEDDDSLMDGDGADLVYGDGGSDTLYASTDNYWDQFFGGDDNDVFYAQYDRTLAKDFFFGGAGDDVFYGKIGNDHFYGGEGTSYYEDLGTDLISYEYMKKAVKIDLSQQYARYRDSKITDRLVEIEDARGTDYDDTIIGDETTNKLYGGKGIDRLVGRGGDDYLEGGEGADILHGGEGNDGVCGNRGNDYIDAGVGDDYVNSGSGNDHIYLGSDKDTFRFSPGHGRDTIYDFELYLDTIYVKGFASVTCFEDILKLASEELGHTVLDFGRDAIVLGNIKNSDLHEDMFAFGTF